MRPFRSVGARLSLALALVVLLALGVLYAIVVPRLERNLTEAKLDQLTRSATVEWNRLPALGPEGFSNPILVSELSVYIENASVATNARVAVLRPLAPRQLTVRLDSRETASAPDLSNDQVALQAILTYAPASGFVERGGRRYAEAAFPCVVGCFEPTVLHFSAPLDDTLANVSLVRQRVLLAGGVALLVSVVAGYLIASIFAGRLRRLERAADRIAQGKLDEPVIDRGSDEVAQLAHAFERMRQRLVQLEHARREFIANASHELRTPIFSLGGFLELLDDEDLDDETRREFVTTMHGQVGRLTKLATDLLDLSRLDAGRLRIELEPVPLGSVAAALAVEFAAIARASGHSIDVIVPDRPPTGLGDEERVLQIGRVLVENALKHTPPGTPIRIRVGGAGGGAVLAVEDSGPGIATEHVPHVFERFYRGEGTQASGSGLGLAIARELSEAMEGTLELDARAGRTVFALRLPVAVGIADELEPAPALSR